MNKQKPSRPDPLRVRAAPIETSNPLPHPSLSGFSWEMGVTLSKLAFVVVALAFTLVLLKEWPWVRERGMALLPDPVARFFTSERAPEAEEGRLSKLRARVLNEVGPRERPAQSKSPAGFTVGSTKDQVRAIQGAPTRATADVWYYGESEVHFINNRVVLWRSSSTSPLRTR